MIVGLAHVCFTVKDLEASEAYYRDGLGLTPAFDFVDDTGRRFGTYLHAGGRNFIELFVGDLAAPAEGQAFRHFCLEVDDIEATAAELRPRRGSGQDRTRLGQQLPGLADGPGRQPDRTAPVHAHQPSGTVAEVAPRGEAGADGGAGDRPWTLRAMRSSSARR